MAETPDGLKAIEAAIMKATEVRGVSALTLVDHPDGGRLVVTRVGLSPRLRLTEVVIAISEVEHSVRSTFPEVRAVFVEPDIAADSATPTETIVIRALD